MNVLVRVSLPIFIKRYKIYQSQNIEWIEINDNRIVQKSKTKTPHRGIWNNFTTCSFCISVNVFVTKKLKVKAIIKLNYEI